jgi:hypothetical protein
MQLCVFSKLTMVLSFLGLEFQILELNPFGNVQTRARRDDVALLALIEHLHQKIYTHVCESLYDIPATRHSTHRTHAARSLGQVVERRDVVRDLVLGLMAHLQRHQHTHTHKVNTQRFFKPRI